MGATGEVAMRLAGAVRQRGAACYTDQIPLRIWLHGAAGGCAGAVGIGSAAVREAADPTTQTRRRRVMAYAEPPTTRYASA